MSKIEAVFVGASAGGVLAVQKLLKEFGDQLSVPVIVVQHLPADSSIQPHLVFGQHTKFNVVEVIDKMPIEKGFVYFAPPSYHLLIEKDRCFSLTQDELVHFSRPSIDVFFESAAMALKDGSCGVLLTGANSDGAAGLKFIKDSGGYTLVQDPKDAEVSAMPASALAIMKPDFIGTIPSIAAKILEIDKGGRND